MYKFRFKALERRVASLCLVLAGVFPIAFAPGASADTLTDQQAYGKTLVDEAIWEKAVNHAEAESPVGSFSIGFAQPGETKSACHAIATTPSPAGAVPVITDFTACDIADPLNLSAVFLAADNQSEAFSFSLMADSPRTPGADILDSSSAASFPISASLWVLAGAATVLVLIGSRIVFGGRALRSSHRR